MDFWNQFWPQFWASIAATAVVALVTVLVTFTSRARLVRWLVRSTHEARENLSARDENDSSEPGAGTAPGNPEQR